MKVTSFNHSCLLVEAAGVRVLIDPGAFSPGWEGLEGLDAVLITHQHQDHVDLTRLPGLALANPGLQLLVEPEVAVLPALFGIEADVRALHADREVAIGGISVQAVGGEHAVIHADIPVIGNIGLVLSDGATRLFHPGDSLAAVPSEIDVLAVPMMAPWMAAKEMIDFSRAVNPRVAVPIHDAMLMPSARGLFLNLMSSHGGAHDVHDLAHGALEI